jgi:lysophospholipase
MSATQQMAFFNSLLVLVFFQQGCYSAAHKKHLMRKPRIMKIHTAVVLFFIILPCSAHAISETDYASQYAATVRPLYEGGTFGEFAGTGGLLIKYAAFEQDNETGALIILHGKSESYIKYAELVYDLQDTGLSCYLMDFRGFGFSERLLDDDPQKVYVDSFDDYVADLKTFIDDIVMAKPHAKLFILAHSMGGCIAARYLEKNPDSLDAAILNSPMLQINTGSYPPSVAYAIASLATTLGMGDQYALGQGPRDDPYFFDATTTHSYARWSTWEEDLIPNNPVIRSGGATYSWVKRSMETGAFARREAARIATPVLLLQAEEDAFVRQEGQDTFCDRAQDCTPVFFYGSRHEILMETDPIRNLALNTIKSFLDKHLKAE